MENGQPARWRMLALERMLPGLRFLTSPPFMQSPCSQGRGGSRHAPLPAPPLVYAPLIFSITVCALTVPFRLFTVSTAEICGRCRIRLFPKTAAGTGNLTAVMV